MAKVTTSIDWPAVRKTRHLKRKMKPPKISKAVKYGLAFFNGLFWALSLLLIGAGYYSITSSDTAAVKLTSVFALLLNISVSLMLVGLVMFVVSLAGILGALRENLLLLRFYRHCVVGFLFLEFGVAVFCFGSGGYVGAVARRDLPRRTVATYRDDTNMQNLLDFLQRQFHCCGVSEQGFHDWSLNVYFNCSEANPSSERCGVPWSCCLAPDRAPIRDYTCGRGVQRLTAMEAIDVIYTDGCIGAVTRWAEEHAHIVGGSCIAVAFAQGAAMYQATRVCVLLERMAPRQRVQGPPLFSVARLALLVALLTGRQRQQDPRGAEEQGQRESPGASGRKRHRGKRKRREGEEGKEEERRKKKEGKDKEEEGKEKEEEGEEDSSSSESDD